MSPDDSKLKGEPLSVNNLDGLKMGSPSHVILNDSWVVQVNNYREYLLANKDGVPADNFDSRDGASGTGGGGGGGCDGCGSA